MPRPDPVCIYHITHLDNLPSIVAAGGLKCDATMVGTGGPPVSIGMASIKQDRLSRAVPCHVGDCVGDYVPFNFCARSVMLFLIHKGNHPGLSYTEGQGEIVHLEVRLHDVIAWAASNRERWAFTLANARAGYAEFRDSVDDLDDLDWDAIASAWFTDSGIKERKQAEFLLHEFLPWELVSRIGVCSNSVRERALRALPGAPPPIVDVMPGWYF